MNERYRTIRLVDPLPCAIWRSQSESVCGDDAYAAHAWRAAHVFDAAPTEVLGLWTLQPVCKRCAEAVYLPEVTP